jgi:hypothetical protein
MSKVSLFWSGSYVIPKGLEQPKPMLLLTVKAKIYDAWESNSFPEKYKKFVEGTKLKQKVRDGKTGVSYQKTRTLCSDASDYFICELLKVELQNFKKKMK